MKKILKSLVITLLVLIVLFSSMIMTASIINLIGIEWTFINALVFILFLRIHEGINNNKE